MPHPTGHIASVVSYKAACFMAGCILRSYRCSYGLWHWAIWCYKTNKSVGRFQRGDFYGDYQNEEALPPNRTGYKHSVALNNNDTLVTILTQFANVVKFCLPSVAISLWTVSPSIGWSICLVTLHRPALWGVHRFVESPRCPQPLAKAPLSTRFLGKYI